MPTRSEEVSAASSLIPLCVPEIRGKEWTYVKDCLDTGWVSSVGSYVERFESAMARYVGTKRAVATVNGTSALHIALVVAGIQPNDEVLVSTLTFIAPANAIRYARAWPVFMDADPVYWEMDLSKVSDFLHKECTWRKGILINKTTKRAVRALLPVHILGHPVDMDPLMELAQKFNLIVIEDATESLGATYKHERVGSIGHIGCFSFNGNKLITTGGGGMITTDNEEWADKARYLTTQAKDDPLEHVHNQIGYNYRLTNLLAAVGCAQLEQIDDYIVAKKRIANRYGHAFRDLPGLDIMREAPWAESVFWMFTVLIGKSDFGLSSRELMRQLNAINIQTRPLWQPLHRSLAHKDSFVYCCDTAEILHRDALSLPCSVGLSEAQQEVVIKAVHAHRSGIRNAGSLPE